MLRAGEQVTTGQVVLGQIRAGCRVNVRQRRIATPVLGRGVGIDDLRRAAIGIEPVQQPLACLLYTSPSPRDVEESRMPSSA